MEQIIHNKCGLPVELCTCPDADVKYDWEKDIFIKQKENKNGREN